MAFSAFAEGTRGVESEGSGKAASAIESSKIKIDINRKGEIMVDGERISLSGLKEFFEERPFNPNDRIVVFADEETNQDNVLYVMDVCCNCKYQNIKLFYKPVWINKG